MRNHGLSCFVLTVDAPDGERRKSAQKQLADVGLDATFVQGFRSGDPSIFQHYAQFKNMFVCKRSLSPGEIAVYCGHRLIWERFIKLGASHALILEDDFAVENRGAFIRSIRESLDHCDQWEIVKLFDYRPKRIVRRASFGSTEAVAYKYPSSGAVAYLLSKEAARRLLGRKRFFRPIDEDFSWAWEFRLRVWSVFPNPVSEASAYLGGSMLEGERKRNKRRKTVLRSLWGIVLQGYKLARSIIYNRVGLQAGPGQVLSADNVPRTSLNDHPSPDPAPLR